MEKRAVIAIAISFLILLGWSYIFPPPKPVEPQLPPSVEQQPGGVPAEPYRARQPDAPPDAEGDETTPSTEPSEQDSPALSAAQVEEIVVDNGRFRAVLTNRGAAAVSWRLHEYTSGNDRPLELIAAYEGDIVQPLSLELDDPGLKDALNTALYEVERLTVSSPTGGGDGDRITFRWSDGRGLEATKSFTFWRDEWLVDAEIDVVDRGRRLPARLTVGPGFGAQEKRAGLSTYAYHSQGVWNVAGNVTRRKSKKLVAQPGSFSARVLWAGLEDQYFAALILPSADQTLVAWHTLEATALPFPGVDEDADPPEAASVPLMTVSIPEQGARIFIGPKKYDLLRGLGNEMEKAVWFATNGFLAWISKHIFLALLWIHDHTIHNYGLAIILATALLRILLFPVNQYSMVSMKKTQLQMQRLQPKLKALKAKHKKKDAQSRQKLNEETMALYKREGVNPMGGVSGCLPMLAQFPILIGFYNMLTVAVELRGAPFFGWITDLSAKDPFWIIPLLMGATMFIQQKMAMSKVKDPMQAQQQKIMMFMPFFFTWICLQMPAGMVLYWFVNNLLGIGQQWLVNRHTGRLEAAAAQKA